MESALSPNTAAFLQYISSQMNGDGDANGNGNGATTSNPPQQTNASIQQQLATSTTSLPPSAFFQIPESTTRTPASKSVSPVDTKASHIGGRSVSLSGSEEGSPLSVDNASGSRQAATAGVDHKRKAGGHHPIEEEGDEDETDSDAATGHEDKRQHQNVKPTKRGGRKSGVSATGEEGTSGKEMSKSARRKEQNRAAQKAFRERREARVTDLEEKVAELEAKSYSSSVENENLRAILKRLQEENVSLKQSAFTFAMPRGGTNGNNSPSSATNGPSPLYRATSKPPTPPYSQADEPLKSIHDTAPIDTSQGARPPHRQSSSGLSGMAASPESLNSAVSSSSSRGLLNGNSPMRFDSFSNFSTDTGITPPSVASDNKSDLEALWASFYPANGANVNVQQPGTQAQSAGNGTGTSQSNSQQSPAVASPNALTQFLAAQMAQGNFQPQPSQPTSQQQPPQQQPQLAAFNPSAANMAYRDSSAPDMSYRDPSAPNMAYRDPSASADPAPLPEFNWDNMNNTSIDDFLASLTGANNTSMDDNPVSAVDDDVFNQQLQAILAGGQFDPSATNTNGGSTAFSPTNYLNMSPSPLNSISNSASPQSAIVSGSGSGSGTSNATSPESSSTGSVPPKELSPDVKPTMGGWACGEVVNVVDANGNVIKPSDLWVKMGMQQQDNVDNLLIDDLCDQMRAKAKCTDNGAQLSVDDFNHMMQYDSTHIQKRTAELKDKYGWGEVFGGKH